MLGEFYTGYAARGGVQGEFYTGNAARVGVQGEVCPAHAVRRGVRGEFCTGSGAVRLVLGEFCTEGVRRGCCWANSVVPWRRPRASWRAMAVPRCSRAPWPALAALFVLGLWCWRVLSRQPAVWCPPAPSTTVVMGGLCHAKPSYGVSPACRSLGWRNSPVLWPPRQILGPFGSSP